MRQYDWWDFRPANELLVEQPGDDQFNEFVAVVKSPDSKVILAYLPSKQTVVMRTTREKYQIRWFDPVKNQYQKDKAKIQNGLMTLTPPADSDWVLELKAE